MQWLVQSCGDSSQFTATSTAGDYIEWAAQKGINGLQADAKLTRGVLAQSLVKLFGIKGNKQGGDPVLILKREGIDLPTEMEITRAGLVNTFDDIGFKTRAQLLAAADMSPSKGGNGIGSGGGTPPPGDPPPNPNYGTTPPGKDPTGTLPHPGRRVGQTR